MDKVIMEMPGWQWEQPLGIAAHKKGCFINCYWYSVAIYSICMCSLFRRRSIWHNCLLQLSAEADKVKENPASHTLSIGLDVHQQCQGTLVLSACNKRM